jgi:hypothetical protein
MHADGIQRHILAVDDFPELPDLFREHFDEECFRVAMVRT